MLLCIQTGSVGRVGFRGSRLPASLALAIVGIVGLTLLGIAIVRFSKTE